MSEKDPFNLGAIDDESIVPAPKNGEGVGSGWEALENLAQDVPAERTAELEQEEQTPVDNPDEQ